MCGGGFDERSTLTTQGVDHHVDVYDNLFLALLSNVRATRQRGYVRNAQSSCHDFRND